MEERMKGLVSFEWRSGLALSIFLLAVAAAFIALQILPQMEIPPIFGDVDPEEDRVSQVQATATNTSVPTETITPSPSPTSTPTVTLIPTASPTLEPSPTPVLMSWAEFQRLVVSGLRMIVVNGFYYYDGEEWSDGFPCPFHTCITYKSDYIELWTRGYTEHQDLNYWCEYMCQGIFQGFGSPWNAVWGNYDSFRRKFGDPSNEFFCPQFSEELDGSNSTCVVPVPTPNGDSQQLTGWPDGWPVDVRQEIVEKWLIPIVSDGYVAYPGTYYYRGWDQSVIDSLSDRQICEIIADHHFYHGFEQYLPADIEKDSYLRDNYRLELRDLLNIDLGQPKGENPPACPGFLEMISPFGLPDFPYTDRQ